ncbi:MAG TPA: nucleotidyltransferase domain-containing protein [Planctomycetota bacterium]|nr:nucleotidyltransferase domain-containing protein [Planctomycetota bacterium]
MDPVIQRALDGFVSAVRETFADDLRAIVLFGSAAEDRLRATSDVNLIIVLHRFDPTRAAAFAALQAPEWTAAQLRHMWLRGDEIAEAAAAFAVKFLDVRRRHRVLHGDDPFAALDVPRAAAVAQLKQTLLGLVLNLRHHLIARGQFEDSLAMAAADASGPLRASAAELLELEGAPAPTPKEALQRVAGDTLAELSRLRDEAALPAGQAGPLTRKLLGLAERMLERVRALA